MKKKTTHKRRRKGSLKAAGVDLTDKLRELIVSSGMSQSELARRSGWDIGGISRFRTEQIIGVTLRTAQRVFDALGWKLVLKRKG